MVIRGLRAISDFEYEFQMAMMNHRLKPKLETFFMMTGESEFYTSSRLVKEVVSLGGNVAGLVPDNVLKKLKEKFKRLRNFAMTVLAERTKLIKPSVTLAIAAKAGKLRAEGIDVVNFSAGEPDFDTPEHIKAAAIEALRKGMTKYTDVKGIEPLREAIVAKISKRIRPQLPQGRCRGQLRRQALAV